MTNCRCLPVLQLARLRHKHPLQTKKALWLKKEGIDLLKDLLGYLKGSNAILLRICRQFRLRATIQLLFGNADDEQKNVQVLCAEVVDMSDITMHHQLWYYIRERHDGKLLCAVEEANEEKDIEVHWVTDAPKANSINSPYTVYGNEASPAHTYMHLCLIVDVGKAGERATATE
ncbi:hypothetical protein SCP_0705140 [Sparassis crispa]|uniref:Uncharacterized protein n=1 Tax=Sparassis crispa TaxID=139825 RepID=A0A401GSZ0_9APHY|nr:hypothetical protein SCP_0705140 [Sparassis crispa]GBE85327.1 hypothetical protein SCP_0705140 [Sparassis crispa]